MGARIYVISFDQFTTRSAQFNETSKNRSVICVFYGIDNVWTGAALTNSVDVSFFEAF